MKRRNNLGGGGKLFLTVLADCRERRSSGLAIALSDFAIFGADDWPGLRDRVPVLFVVNYQLRTLV